MREKQRSLECEKQRLIEKSLEEVPVPTKQPRYQSNKEEKKEEVQS